MLETAGRCVTPIRTIETEANLETRSLDLPVLVTVTVLDESVSISLGTKPGGVEMFSAVDAPGLGSQVSSRGIGERC